MTDLPSLTEAMTDRHLGALIRQRRRVRGFSLQSLAAVVGVSYQQLQKYENGTNRVSATMLYRIAYALACEPGLFFEGLPRPAGQEPDVMEASLKEIGEAFFSAPGGLELAWAYLALTPAHRRAILAASRAFG